MEEARLIGRKQSGVLVRDVGAESGSRLMLARRVVRKAVRLCVRRGTLKLLLPVACSLHTCRSSKSWYLISHRSSTGVVEQGSRGIVIDNRSNGEKRRRKSVRRRRRVSRRRKVEMVGQLHVVVVPAHGGGTFLPSLAQNDVVRREKDIKTPLSQGKCEWRREKGRRGVSKRLI